MQNPQRSSCGATLGWPLLGGFVSTAIFISGMYLYAALFTEGALRTPTAHGAWGASLEMLILVFGAIPVMVIGMFIGFVLAASQNG